MDTEVITITESDLGANKPVVKVEDPPKMRPVQHGVVVACGHKLEHGRFPRQANCFDCWEALFETTPDGVQSVHSLLMQSGTQAVEQMHGKKFVKMFGRYLRKKLLEMHKQKTSEAPGIEILDINTERNSNADRSLVSA